MLDLALVNKHLPLRLVHLRKISRLLRPYALEPLQEGMVVDSGLFHVSPAIGEVPEEYVSHAVVALFEHSMEVLLDGVESDVLVCFFVLEEHLVG